MEKKEYTSPYDFEGKIPLKQAIILGLQHVLAMFVLHDVAHQKNFFRYFLI